MNVMLKKLLLSLTLLFVAACTLSTPADAQVVVRVGHRHHRHYHHRHYHHPYHR